MGENDENLERRKGRDLGRHEEKEIFILDVDFYLLRFHFLSFLSPERSLPLFTKNF